MKISIKFEPRDFYAELDRNVAIKQLARLADSKVNSAAKSWFEKLWDSLNSKRGYSFESNPWVRVISFKRVNL